MKCSDNILIISLIMNIIAESATHMEEFLTIGCCQVDELDCRDIGDINHISEDVILLWQKRILRNSHLIEVDIDIDFDYDHHESNS